VDALSAFRPTSFLNCVLGMTAVATLLVACSEQHPTPTPRRGEVLVLSEGASIVTVHSDGTHKTVLPKKGITPSWTPDGRIIFVSAPQRQIWVMAADGTGAHQIGDLRLEQGNPIVKPQLAKNGLVAFADMQGKPAPGADNPGRQNGTWVMHSDGTGLRLVISHCTAPSLALSGTWLTCTKETNRHREIWRVQADGSGARQLTFPTDADYPDGNASAISPDERTIAFFSGKESDLGTSGFTQSVLTWGHRNVALMPAAGGARRTLTACVPVTSAAQVKALPPGGCLAADNPAWSPDGKRIVYDRGSPRAADGGTWIINVDGTNNHRLWPQTRGAGSVPLR
jgi:Tol biopolymer transport system component